MTTYDGVYFFYVECNFYSYQSAMAAAQLRTLNAGDASVLRIETSLQP